MDSKYLPSGVCRLEAMYRQYIYPQGLVNLKPCTGKNFPQGVVNLKPCTGEVRETLFLCKPYVPTCGTCRCSSFEPDYGQMGFLMTHADFLRPGPLMPSPCSLSHPSCESRLLRGQLILSTCHLHHELMNHLHHDIKTLQKPYPS